MSLSTLFHALKIKTHHGRADSPKFADLIRPVSDQSPLDEYQRALLAQRDEQLKADELPTSECRCPACHTSDVILVLDGVEIDYCRRCKGIWLDSTELRHFTHLMRDVPGEDLSSRPSRFECPVCGERMTEFQFHPHTNLMVDSCRSHGVFLEDDELRRALVASNQGDE